MFPLRPTICQTLKFNFENLGPFWPKIGQFSTFFRHSSQAVNDIDRTHNIIFEGHFMGDQMVPKCFPSDLPYAKYPTLTSHKISLLLKISNGTKYIPRLDNWQLQNNNMSLKYQMASNTSIG